jgi:hypothetical protein
MVRFYLPRGKSALLARLLSMTNVHVFGQGEEDHASGRVRTLDRWEFLCAFSPKDVPKCSKRDRPYNALDIEYPFMSEREHVMSPVLSRVR